MTRFSAVAALVIGALVVLACGTAEAQWPPFPNPVVIDTGHQYAGTYYDPFSGRWVVQTSRTSVRASTFDPNRGWVDPGSLRYVNEIQYDANGVAWRVQGYRWTSNGVPHGDLRRIRIHSTGYPGVDHQVNERVLFSRAPR